MRLAGRSSNNRDQDSMEDSEGDLSILREAILFELHPNQIIAKSLVQHLRTLVALTDPEDGILFQTPDGFKLPGQLENLIGCSKV
ncbi:Hypothetical predicted protein [Podarcis lilfordi]|uniref:Uncharacterized protein n=1 Tax=Podarcis lilfordi TaxID=74358 RepID=A0AA35JR97_9SAUR|nr:Hypothetical predicted protein [Podarcis lilfordi]